MIIKLHNIDNRIFKKFNVLSFFEKSQFFFNLVIFQKIS